MTAPANSFHKNILIASSSLDKGAWEPVANDLAKRSYNVLVYKADEVADGRIQLSVTMGNTGTVAVSYNDKPLQLDTVAAAWYRRPSMFSSETGAKRTILDVEAAGTQANLWALVPQKAWLNSPENIFRADRKLIQLLVAKEVGFTIPDTVISNAWPPIGELSAKAIVYKTTKGQSARDDKELAHFTTRFHNKLATLPTGKNPFPGFWQTYIKKKREWRITVVGDKSF
ncbi:MAG: hypothetical protein AAB834_06515, partial [Patescibacteria group bacterium]